MRLLTILCSVSMLAGVQARADILLNEVVTLNGIDGFKSAEGFAYDWIELHNDGGQAVDLDGYFLTDDPGILRKWKFPGSFVIAAGDYAIVFASDRNGVVEGETHTNFKLSSTDGDHLVLVAPDGATVQSQILPSIPRLKQYVSFGRVEDGDIFEVLDSATPGASNSGIAPVPIIESFSASKGALKGGEELTLTWQTSKADAVKLWSSPSPTAFFTQLDKVSPEGTAVFTPIENTTYRLTVENQFGLRESITSVSVGASITSFSIKPSTVVPGGRTILRWDSSGTGHTVDLNDGFGVRRLSPQIYTPWNEMLIEKRSEWKQAPSAPAPGWEQPGFDDSQWPVSAGPLEPAQNFYLRKTIEIADPAELAGYSLRVLSGTSFQVYVNGQGIPLVENFSFAGNAESYCEVSLDAESLVPGSNVIAVHSMNGTFDAALTAWRLQEEEINQTLTLAAANEHGSAEATATVKMLPRTFSPPPLPPIAVTEFFWSYNGTLPPEPYRFFEIHNFSDHPIDLSGIQLAGSAIADLSAARPQTLKADGFALIVAEPMTWTEELPIIGHFENAQAAETYQFGIDQGLLDPFGRMFERFGYSYPGDFHGGPTEPLQRIDESKPPAYPDNWELGSIPQGTPGGPSFRLIEFFVSPETGRPGDTIEVHWKASHDVPLTLSEGIGPVQGPIGSASFVIPNNGRQPQVFLTAETPFGTVRKSRMVTLEPQIHRLWLDSNSIRPGQPVRANWDLARTSIGTQQIDPDVGNVRSNGPFEFIPLQVGGFFTKTLWRYVADGTDLGEAWKTVEFNDRRWRYQRGIFGYGNDNIVTETPNDNFDWVTAYFRRHFEVADAASVEKLSLDLLFDDGVEVYINGIEVLRENLPAGEIKFDTPAAAQKVDDGREYQEFQVDPSVLVDGDNVIAVGVHNRSAKSEDLAFDLGLSAMRAVPPEGRANYTFTVSNAAGSASAVMTILFDDAETHIQDWALANGLVGDPTTTDSDADGLVDAIEFVVGSDPLTPSPEPLSVEFDGDGHIELRFPSDLHATGYDIQLQNSENLREWSPINAGLIYLGGSAAPGSSIVEHVYRSVIPAKSGTNYFRIGVVEAARP